MLQFSRRGLLVSATAALAYPLVLGGRVWAAVPSPMSLTVERRTIEIDGRPLAALGIRQPDGTPGLTLDPGERFAVELRNRLNEPTLIHWHGQTPPSEQDGVPDLSQTSIEPGASWWYDYEPRSGTHWMHSHVGLQEQSLLAAPLIVRTKEDLSADQQEVVVFLQDFSYHDPEEVFADLREDTAEASGMKMTEGAGDMEPDLNDVEYDAFLANERNLNDPQVVRVEAGSRIRLRIINGAGSTNFMIDLGALEGQVIAADGNPVAPVVGRRFPIAVAQRLDILVQLPKEQQAWPVLALREGDAARTGIVLATRAGQVQRLAPWAKTKERAIGPAFEERLSAVEPIAVRAVDRSHRLALTGDMRRYIWGLNGRSWGEHAPLEVKTGERVEIVFDNQTMMSHPMHLHGHHFQVVAVNDRRFSGAVRDSVLVPAKGSVTVAFDADNPGRWALHCHNVFHLDAGMMTEVRYAAIV